MGQRGGVDELSFKCTEFIPFIVYQGEFNGSCNRELEYQENNESSGFFLR